MQGSPSASQCSLLVVHVCVLFQWARCTAPGLYSGAEIWSDQVAPKQEQPHTGITPHKGHYIVWHLLRSFAGKVCALERKEADEGVHSCNDMQVLPMKCPRYLLLGMEPV